MSNQSKMTMAEFKRFKAKEKLDEARAARLNANIELVKEQQEVLNWVKRGNNVKLTGEGGSGKTVTLIAVIKWLKTFYNNRTELFAVCASTGAAAVNLIGGKTVHSMFGMKPGTENLSCEEHFRNNILAKNWVRVPLEKLQFLLIDEDSMLKASDLDKIDYALRHIPCQNPNYNYKEDKSHLPFGGRQILLCGDFSQLPPVFTSHEGPNARRGALLFQSEAYAKGNFKEIMLKTNHRQSRDIRMQYILNCIRKGEINSFVEESLGQLRIPLEYRELNGLDEVSCKLHCTRADVDSYNLQKMRELPGPEFIFDASDHCDPKFEFLMKSMRFQKQLVLRVGSKVRLLYNYDIDMNLVNGTAGVVIGFFGLPDNVPENGVCRIQAHKMEDKDFGVIVRFWLAENVHHEIEIMPYRSELGGMSKVLASRLQIPLALTFATTVHAAQGQTHPCFELDLRDAFEFGQGYVGLSRGTTLNGVYLSGFVSSRIKCDPAVVEFYKKFETPETLKKEKELEKQALAMGPFKVVLKEEFKHLEGTFCTNFDDMNVKLPPREKTKKRKFGAIGEDGENSDGEEEEEPYFLGVTGSKHFNDYDKFSSWMTKYSPQKSITIVTGDKEGVEEMALRYADEKGLPVIEQKLQKQVGDTDDERKKNKRLKLLRNSQEIFLFFSKGDKNRGTKDFIAERDSQEFKKKLQKFNQ